jgi:RimJ/RimL family protein N-acetyltransferase
VLEEGEMKIKTKLFLLRPPEKGDEVSLWENYNDKEIARKMVTMETEREFKREFLEKLKKKDKSRDSFVIVVDEKPVGKISIRNIIPKLSGRTSSWIGKEHRGKGIVTKARTLATNYWFKKYKLVRIEAGTRIYNKAAQRSLEKSGYKLEGRLRKRILKNGKYYDDFIYARVR